MTTTPEPAQAVPVDEEEPRGGDGAPSDLDIQQELRFQDRSLRLQHLGWVLMVLLAVGGLVGLFGEGPISQARASDGALTVEWSRFARHHAETELQVEIDRGAGPVEISFTVVPEGLWGTSGRVASGDGEVRIDQVVWP